MFFIVILWARVLFEKLIVRVRSVCLELPQILLVASMCHSEPCSSVSTASGYGLDDRAIEVRSPAGAEDFSSTLCVQTGSGAHPASCTMGTGGPFPGDKSQPGHDADRSPSSVEVENEYELYLLSSQAPPWRVVGQL
jgi:hypothetical protein